MALPLSFQRDGFVKPSLARTRMKLPNGKFLKPLMIGTEGKSDTGKSEFILSCPGPGLIICLDRQFGPLLDNPNPPKSRRIDDFAISVINIPLNKTTEQTEYGKYYAEVRDKYYKALVNPDAVTVAMDGDSDFWELLRLADHGKLANVWPQTKYGDTYARRRASTARAHDSGKIVIGTNKVRDEYEVVLGTDGKPVKGTDGEDLKRKTGNDQRQGFPDQNYLWDIQLKHLYKPPHYHEKLKKQIPGSWGIRILKCKANTELVGTELWNQDCNFRGLVETVYPNVDPAEWNLKA